MQSYANRQGRLGSSRPLHQKNVISRSRLISARAAPAEKFDAQVAVVLGTQWGDEGKGKLVDILAQQYDIVARSQVGMNTSYFV